MLSEEKKSKKRSQSEFKKKEVKNLLNPGGFVNKNQQVFQNQYSPTSFQPGPLNFQNGIFINNASNQKSGIQTGIFESPEVFNRQNTNFIYNAQPQLHSFSPQLVSGAGFRSRLSPEKGQTVQQISSYGALNPQQQQSLVQQVVPQQQMAYSNFSPQQVFNAAANQQQVITSNVPLVNTHAAIKGESYFEQVPFETIYVEQIPIQKVEYVPVERRVQEYIALEHQMEYVPKARVERKVNYQPVERTEYEAVKKTEYVPVEKVNYVAKPIRDYVAVQDVEETVEYKPVNKQIIHYPRNPDGTSMIPELNNVVYSNNSNVNAVLYNSGVTATSPYSSTYISGVGNIAYGNQVTSGVYSTGQAFDQMQMNYKPRDLSPQNYRVQGQVQGQGQIQVQGQGQNQTQTQFQSNQIVNYQQQNARSNNFSRQQYQQQFSGEKQFYSPESDFKGPTGLLFKEEPIINVHQSGLMGYHDPRRTQQAATGIRRLSPGRFAIEKYEGGISNAKGIKLNK